MKTTDKAARVATCPECGTESTRIVTEYDRVFPVPRERMVRFQCVQRGCGSEARKRSKKTIWDVPALELEVVK